MSRPFCAESTLPRRDVYVVDQPSGRSAPVVCSFVAVQRSVTLGPKLNPFRKEAMFAGFHRLVISSSQQRWSPSLHSGGDSYQKNAEHSVLLEQRLLAWP